MQRTRWFIYTVVVGLVPVLARALVYFALSSKPTGLVLKAMDFAVLGLVVNISNINFLEGSKLKDKGWKAGAIGFSVVLIVLFAVLFTISIFQEAMSTAIDSTANLIAAIALAAGSLLLGYAVSNRLNTIRGATNE